MSQSIWLSYDKPTGTYIRHFTKNLGFFWHFTCKLWIVRDWKVILFLLPLQKRTQCGHWPCKGSFKDKSPQWWLPRIVDHMSSQKEGGKSIASSLYMDDVNGIKHAVSQKLFSTWDYRRCDIYLLVFLVHWPCDILNEPTTSEIPLLHGTWPVTLSWSEIWTQTILKMKIQKVNPINSKIYS